jgi:cyclic pyranopterin phosphate synthase
LNSFLGTLPEATSLMESKAPMIDPFGRAVTYLRVSVTDRCDFRCTYCMSEHMTFLPKKDLLTLEELNRLCSAFIAKGVRKIRLTGGEPLVRKNIMQLVGDLGQHVGNGTLDELTLTTNGNCTIPACVVSTFHSIRSTPRSFARSPAGATSPRLWPASMLRWPQA